MQKTCVAIRHVFFEGLGSFEAVLQEQGYDIQYVEAATDDLSAAIDADLTVVLGGPIGVYEVDDFPFLAKEIEIIERRIAENKPTLGLCLGAQLIAKAAGAEVYPGENGQEIGWLPVSLTEAGKDSVIDCLAEGEGIVLHWHGDTFDLPTGGKLLASTEQYPHQAFSLGTNILALQFHFEVLEKDMEHWFVASVGKISQTEGVSVKKLRAETQKHAVQMENMARDFMVKWLSQLENS